MVVEADPIMVVKPTVIESEGSTGSMRLATQKRNRYGEQVCCKFLLAYK